ncbi:MAG: hypothetical protein OXI60_02190 [Acidiferrobacterales bacterium]|nr:hypothetical protein [Acidiferrobacterales bacterium]
MSDPALEFDEIKLPEVALRPPSEVMRLDRLGSMHPSRLSFTRTLVRRMHAEKWRFDPVRKSLDADGLGNLVYSIVTPSGPLSFIAFSTQLDDKDRTDRVIAEKWDMSFTLFNGEAGQKDIERLGREVPLQEAGRLSSREIVLSRANKSVRLFNSVVDSLAAGRQPSASDIASIGYLTRTTAVYGNGKFGLMDYDQVKRVSPFGPPFQAEMLTVYMARQLSLDLVDHLARRRGGEQAVQLSRPLRRAVGVGNATGLGMAPFLVSHPRLIHQWVWLREVALSRVKSQKSVTVSVVQRCDELLERLKAHLDQWNSTDSQQSERVRVLKDEVVEVHKLVRTLHERQYPWQHLTQWATGAASLECAELIHSLILELYPELVDDLDRFMGSNEAPINIDSSMTIEQLKSHIERNYAWALDIDFDGKDAQGQFWYISAEKEEPRLGLRDEDPGSELEMRIHVARDIFKLYGDITSLSRNERQSSVINFLRTSPHYRHIANRIHSLCEYPYAEIQENLLDASCRPIDLLRFKLATFGATRFDPKSDLWTRITLFQGAPLMDELDVCDADDWAFPFVHGNSEN